MANIRTTREMDHGGKYSIKTNVQYAAYIAVPHLSAKHKDTKPPEELRKKQFASLYPYHADPIKIK